VTLIESLSLISFNIEQYRKGDIDEEVERVHSTRMPDWHPEIALLKRLESHCRLRGQYPATAAVSGRFFEMLVKHERLLDYATKRRLLALEALEDDILTDDIEAFIVSLPEADIREYDLRLFGANSARYGHAGRHPGHD
jgi:hypothetical protein